MVYRINKAFWLALSLAALISSLMYAGSYLFNEGFDSVEGRAIIVMIVLLFFTTARAAKELGVGLVANDTRDPFYQLHRQTYRVLAKAPSRKDTELLIVADLDEMNDWTIRVPKGLIRSEYFRLEGSPKRAAEIYDRAISRELPRHVGGSDFYRSADPLSTKREQVEDTVFTLPKVDLSLLRQ